MNPIVRLGTPTHLKVSGGEEPSIKWTACGLIGTPSHGAAYDPRHVDCLNCQRTEEYRRRMHGDKEKTS